MTNHNSISIKRIIKALTRALKEGDIEYKRGPFMVKEKGHKYRIDYGYIQPDDTIVIDKNLPLSERCKTLNHELIHKAFPYFSEKKTEMLAIELFEKYNFGFDFLYFKKEKKIKCQKIENLKEN